MSTGIIFTGGEAPDKRFCGDENFSGAFVIAADSGLDTALSWGIMPDMVVGDMDSVKNKKKLDDFPPDRVKIFQKEKDETDTEIALRELYERNVDEVVLIGGGGGRLDHLLGIVSIFDRSYCPSRWYTGKDKIFSITGRAVFTGMRGQEISFFPAGSSLCRMKSTGLKWPLDGLEWSKGDAGISNIVLEDIFSIEMVSGRLIMVSRLKES